MRRYATALLILLTASTAHGSGWEVRRVPISPEDRADLKRVAKLTPLSRAELEAAIEMERYSYNTEVMSFYNRQQPWRIPASPTPEVPPPARRGIHRFIH